MDLVNAGKDKKKTDRVVPTFQDASDTPVVEMVEDKEVHTVNEIVDSVIHAPSTKPKRQISVYIDANVAVAFDRFGKRNGKGSKSNLINNFLKKALDVKE